MWLQKNNLVIGFSQTCWNLLISTDGVEDQDEQFKGFTSLCFMKSTFLWGYFLNIKNSAVYFTQKNILIGNFLLCSLNEEYLPFLFVANACRGNSLFAGKSTISVCRLCARGFGTQHAQLHWDSRYRQNADFWCVLGCFCIYAIAIE